MTLVSLFGGGSSTNYPQDPSNVDHEDSSSKMEISAKSDKDLQVSADKANSNPAGLFGDAPSDNEGKSIEDHGAAYNCHVNQPGARPTTTTGKNQYQTNYRLAWEKIASLEGTVVKEGRGTNKIC